MWSEPLCLCVVVMSLLERKRGTGGKFKKNSKRTLQLSNEDLEYLKKNTALEEKDIQEWFRYVVGQINIFPVFKIVFPKRIHWRQSWRPDEKGQATGDVYQCALKCKSKTICQPDIFQIWHRQQWKHRLQGIPLLKESRHLSTLPLRNLWWRPRCQETRVTNWGWLSGRNQEWNTTVSLTEYVTGIFFEGLRWGRERDCGQGGDGGDCQQHVHLPGGRHGEYHSW